MWQPFRENVDEYIVNYQYLKQFPMIDISGKKLNINLETDQCFVLVPESLKDIDIQQFLQERNMKLEKVVINKKEYEVSKILEDEVERYSVNLMAPNKAGYESLKLQKVIMSDKTVVDIDKTVNINVLKEDATLNDVVVEDESNGNNELKISFNLKDKKDIDNTDRIFFTKKKGGLVVYTSTLRNTEQPASKELIENIKMLDLQ